MTRRVIGPVIGIIALGVLVAGCGTPVGAGLAAVQPSPWRGIWGESVYVGGPVYR